MRMLKKLIVRIGILLIILVFSAEWIAEQALMFYKGKLPGLIFTHVSVEVWPGVVRAWPVTINNQYFGFTSRDVSILFDYGRTLAEPVILKALFVNQFRLRIKDLILPSCASAYHVYSGYKITRNEEMFQSITFRNGRIDIVPDVPLLKNLRITGCHGMFNFNVLGENELVQAFKGDFPSGAKMNLSSAQFPRKKYRILKGAISSIPVKNRKGTIELDIAGQEQGTKGMIDLSAIKKDTHGTPVETVADIHAGFELDNTLSGTASWQIFDRSCPVTGKTEYRLDKKRAYTTVECRTLASAKSLPFLPEDIADKIKQDVICDCEFTFFHPDTKLTISTFSVKNQYLTAITNGTLTLDPTTKMMETDIQGAFAFPSIVEEVGKGNFLLLALKREILSGMQFRYTSRFDLKNRSVKDVHGLITTKNLDLDISANLSYSAGLAGDIHVFDDKIDADIFHEAKHIFHYDNKKIYLTNFEASLGVVDRQVRCKEISFYLYDAPVNITYEKDWIFRVKNIPADQLLPLFYPPYEKISGSANLYLVLMKDYVVDGTLEIGTGSIKNVNILNYMLSSIPSQSMVGKMIAALNKGAENITSTPFSSTKLKFHRTKESFVLRELRMDCPGFSILSPHIEIRNGQISGKGELYIFSARPVGNIWRMVTPDIFNSLEFIPTEGLIRIPFSITGSLNAPHFDFLEIFNLPVLDQIPFPGNFLKKNMQE